MHHTIIPKNQAGSVPDEFSTHPDINVENLMNVDIGFVGSDW